MSTTTRRYYIDRADGANEPVIRAVAITPVRRAPRQEPRRQPDARNARRRFLSTIRRRAR